MVGADRGIDQLISHQIRQFFAVIIGDDFQHQINRGGAACGGDAVAINHKDRFCQGDVFEFFGKAVLVFPMDRGAFAVQQPRLGQSIACGAQPAHNRTAPRLAPQPVENALRCGGLHINPAAQHDCVFAGQLFEIHI